MQIIDQRVAMTEGQLGEVMEYIKNEPTQARSQELYGSLQTLTAMRGEVLGYKREIETLGKQIPPLEEEKVDAPTPIKDTFTKYEGAPKSP